MLGAINALAAIVVEDAAKFRPIEFALGILAATVAFFIKELVAEKRRQRQRYLDASNVLLNASDEVVFYAGKLKQLVSDIDNNLLSLASGTLIVPSYSLYPEFIAGLRVALTDRRAIRPALFASIGECHFELAHLSQRLEDGKVRMVRLTQELETSKSWPTSLSEKDKEALNIYITNWRGVQKLARENIQRFKGAGAELRLESRKIRAALDGCKSWFSNNIAELISRQEVGADPASRSTSGSD